jgi:hypothetical protein
VDITPEAVSLWWGPDDRDLLQIASRPKAALESLLLDSVQIRPEMATVPTTFAPRAGLGLFVHKGKAAFRRIVVKPM